MNYNKYSKVHIIKHIHTSTLYGITKQKNNYNMSFLTCFNKKQDAKHIINSINIHRNIHKKNPNTCSLCVYKIEDLKNLEYDSKLESGLYCSEMYLNDIFDITSNRNLGLYYIKDILQEEDYVNVNSILLYPYHNVDNNLTLTKYKRIIENDYMI